MIKINNLYKSFNGHKILEGVSAEVGAGETLAVIGPSGCGKSTLLKLILMLELPDSGQILINDRDISRLNEDQLVKVRQKIGMVFQSSALFDSMNVYENVAFALREHTQMAEYEIKKKVAEKLELVDLSGKEKLMPSELSGGMQKRVCIARALAFDPHLILYDEPTTGLDPITSTTIENLMNKLAKELKAASIVVTHQLSTIFRTAHRIIMLEQGKFLIGGTVDETRRSKNPVIRKFITAGLEE
jgi:phospholipid/cholesterol/gamma-HCH transport system ATP-binding protein